MAAIEEIPGINGTTLDLFRAAGILNSGDLLALGTEELMERLDEANGDGEMVARLPAKSAVDAWRGAAKVFEGGGGGGGRAKLSSDVMKKVRSPGLPTARQMLSQQLREAGIPASQVPIGKLLADVDAEVSVEMDAEVASDAEVGQFVGEAAVQKDEMRKEKTVEKTVENVAESVNEATAEPELEVQPDRTGGSSRSEGGDLQVRKLGSVRGPGETIGEFTQTFSDRPVSRQMERRNNGMLHRDPGSVYLGALATLVAMTLVGLGFVAVGAALVYTFYNEEPVPKLMLWVLPAFPVALLLHVTLGVRPRCRLCGQQLFRPKSCNKHVKSHRSPFGHIFAVALHVVTRGWFRCMLCGTKQRLRE